MRKRMILAVAIVIVGAWAAGVLIQVGGDLRAAKPSSVAKGADLSAFAASPPAEPIDLAFLYDDVGEQMLAERGLSDGQRGMLTRHPNGGGMAALLAQNGYRLHVATYGSRLGEYTDLFDWLPKFQYEMDAVLSIKRQDETLPAGRKNRVVMFMPSSSDSDFVGPDEGPGNADGPELTVANARAAMKAVRNELARRPDTLFVYLTAPPGAPMTWREPAWKWLIKKAAGRPTHDDEMRMSAGWARAFNNWIVDPQGWLAGYPHRNIVVFDLFNTLTGHGASNFSVYATGDGWDAHPSSDGNSKVAPELVAFLNRAVRYAGIAK